MSYRHTLEAALESLYEVEDLLKGFSDNNQVPPIEIDLALQKLRNLYELLLLIRGIDTLPQHTKQPVTSPDRADAPVKEDKTPEPPEQKKIQVTEPEAKPPEVITEKIKETVVEIKEAYIEKKEETVKKSRAEKNMQTLADQFRDRTTLLESLHQTYGRESEHTAHIKPVSDLMAAIALNDRFTFVRELFNNDKTAFENAIAVLNNSANFNEAYNFMSQQFNWDMDSEPVQMLLDIIRRKFIKGRHE
ncbi:MAG TPA: hypothetical protein VK179_17185 [Bacteroidales bacterium]|nr:hypothetical protein [Bacteroidales bacterium]